MRRCTILFVKRTRSIRILREPAFIGLGAMACVALFLLGCGESSPSPAARRPPVFYGEGERPSVRIPAGPPPTKLVIEDLEKGSGRRARNGDEIAVRYFRFDYQTHLVYANQWHESPVSFTLGAGQMLGAWEAGIPGIRPGERRELVVPGQMTFVGVPEIHVVEALSVKPRTLPEERAEATLVQTAGLGPRPRMKVAGGPIRKLVVRELAPGTGRGAVPGERLGVRFVGVNIKTRQRWEFWRANPPYSFVLGDGIVRKGWEIGLKGMKLGARRELLLPSELAYGKGPMVYVVELLEMEKAKASTT
jgi:FKBP-type peptidyl-prolyl cis-trans isomerase